MATARAGAFAGGLSGAVGGGLFGLIGGAAVAAFRNDSHATGDKIVSGGIIGGAILGAIAGAVLGAGPCDNTGALPKATGT